MEVKTDMPVINEVETNNLFPVFLKLEELSLLLVGAGTVGLEKLSSILTNAPQTRVTVVAPDVSEQLRLLAAAHENVRIIEKHYDPTDLDNIQLAIVAVGDQTLTAAIRRDAGARGILLNAADKPELCDFYLGSVVRKGNLKIAISTNGKSPTIAKRLKEVFNEVLPDELDEVLKNMQIIRGRLSGNFTDKVNKLNILTKDLALNGNTASKKGETRWRRVATYCLAAFFLMIGGHVLLSYIPFNDLIVSLKGLPKRLDPTFYWMVTAGFAAQLVDGALGMGYGVTCTTILLSLGVPLPAISGSIHTAEMFSSGMSGYSHYKFGNVNKKLFKALLIPGIVGAVIGAYALSKFGTRYADYIKPLLAAYTLFLGVKIIYGAFRKTKPKKIKRVGWLAGAGGFLDSFGGGGWGPLVTSTLISKGRTPRYVIGSVSISEFFVTFASALTFFSLIGLSHWQIIVGLILGGTLAAPLAAKLAGRLPLKTMFISVGALVVIWSLRILLIAIGVF